MPKTYHTTTEDALEAAHSAGWRSVKCPGCEVEGLFGSIHGDTTCPVCETERPAVEALALLAPEVAAWIVYDFIRKVVAADHGETSPVGWEVFFKSTLGGLL